MPKKKSSQSEQPNEQSPNLKPAVYRVLEIVDHGSSPFHQWLTELRDRTARARVLSRLVRIEEGGNFGDHRERISMVVSELRIDHGPGYRVYYVQHGDLLVILLGGGVKSSQQDDILAASALWEKSKDDVERLSREFRGGSA